MNSLSPKTCLIIATMMEAKPLFQSQAFEKKWQSQNTAFYSSKQFDLLISGIGPVSTAYACGRIQHLEHSKWINLGIAGSLSKDLPIEEIVPIGSCTSFEKNPINPSLNTICFNDGKTLFTVNEAVHDTQKKQELALKAQVVDMEGYSIAFSAHLSHKKLTMIKIISDLADGNNKDSLFERIHSLMTKLFDSVNLK